MVKTKAQIFLTVATLTLFLIVALAGITSPALGKDFSKTLKFADAFPPKSFPGGLHKWWASELEKRTNGRIKVKLFWMGSLVKWKDMLHGVSAGIADVGHIASTYHSSELPLFMLIDLPYNATDYWAAMMACTDTAWNEPNLRAELERNNIKVIGPWCSGGFNICTRKAFRSLADLKGETFRSYGGAWINLAQNVGINPIFMPYSEIYEALDRGAIDGNFNCPWQISDAFKHQEVVKQASAIDWGFIVGGSSIQMNLKVWNGLPKDIQEIIKQLCFDTTEYWTKKLHEVEAPIKVKWEKAGVICNEMSPEDDAIMRAAGQKAQDAFIKKLESQGHPARKTWDYFRSRVAHYEKEVKEKGYPWER